jgi:RNA polymerase sigma factor (sigma-70 family)
VRRTSSTASVHPGSIVRHLRQVVGDQAIRESTDAELLKRFLALGEQDAFALLVRRHGPMVWGVCRHLARGEQDAEDAFQAVFLVLARSGASIRRREAVAGWLHGVACRVARRANRRNARRRERERRAAVPEEAPAPDPGWRELQARLDEALDGLPEKYRAPFVLCCLEARPRKDVARELSLPEGTVSSRIARARRLLQGALERRGVTLTAALTAGELWRQSAHATLPQALAHLAVTSATDGGAAASAAVLAQAQGVAGGTAGRMLACVGAMLLGLTAAAVAVGYGPGHEPTDKQEAQPAAAAAAPVDAHGDPLPADAVARLGTIRFRHGAPIHLLTFTPDGKQVISWGRQSAKVWEVATRREVARLSPTEKRLIQGALLRPGGDTLVVIEHERKIGSVARVRRRADFSVIREFRASDMRLLCLSPDGKLLCGAPYSDPSYRTVEIWDVNEGRKLRSIKAHQDYLWCARLSPDGKTMATAAEDNRIRLWDVTTGRLKREITGLPGIVTNAAFSGDGAVLATLGVTKKLGRAGTTAWASYHCDDYISVREVATGKELRQLRMPLRPGFQSEANVFPALAFAPDGKTLACGNQDGVLHLWDATTGTEIRTLPVGMRHPSALAFSPDGKTIALGDTSISLIDTATGKEVGADHGHHQRIHAVALTPDGRTTVTAAGDGMVVLWDLESGRERGRLLRRDDPVASMRLLPDGRTLIWADREKALRLWEPATRREPRQIRTAKAALGPLAVSRDGKQAAVPGTDQSIVLIDLLTGEEAGRLPTAKEQVYGAAFAPDGHSLLVWFHDHTLGKWDLRTRKRVLDFALPVWRRFMKGPDLVHSAYGLEVSPNGRLIAYGSQEHYLALRDAATGEVLGLTDDLSDGPLTLAFSPDGRMLALAGYYSTAIRLIEVATGKERHVFDGHGYYVRSLAFTPDARRLVSGSEDTTALVWGVMGRPPAKGGAPGDKALDACWADLADADAARAFRAMRRLAHSPAEATAFLRKRLPLVPTPDEKRVRSLLADLDSDVYARRESATTELAKLGEAATDACRKALAAGPSAEKRRRLERLVRPFDDQPWNPSAERLRILRAIEMLERLDEPGARDHIRALAAGAPGAFLTREAREVLARRTGRER